MQPDSVIPDLLNSQAWNRFSYTINNPINFSDPSGHSEICIDGCYQDPPPAQNINIEINCSSGICMDGVSTTNEVISDLFFGFSGDIVLPDNFLDNLGGLTANGKDMIELYKEYRNNGGHWIGNHYDDSFSILDFFTMAVYTETSGLSLETIGLFNMIGEAMYNYIRWWGDTGLNPNSTGNIYSAIFNFAGGMESMLRRAEKFGAGEWYLPQKWNKISSMAAAAFPTVSQFQNSSVDQNAIVGWANQSLYTGTVDGMTIYQAHIGVNVNQVRARYFGNKGSSFILLTLKQRDYWYEAVNQ